MTEKKEYLKIVYTKDWKDYWYCDKHMHRFDLSLDECPLCKRAREWAMANTHPNQEEPAPQKRVRRASGEEPPTKKGFDL